MLKLFDMCVFHRFPSLFPLPTRVVRLHPGPCAFATYTLRRCFWNAKSFKPTSKFTALVRTGSGALIPSPITLKAQTQQSSILLPSRPTVLVFFYALSLSLRSLSCSVLLAVVLWALVSTRGFVRHRIHLCCCCCQFFVRPFPVLSLSHSLFLFISFSYAPPEAISDGKTPRFFAMWWWVSSGWVENKRACQLLHSLSCLSPSPIVEVCKHGGGATRVYMCVGMCDGWLMV